MNLREYDLNKVGALDFGKWRKKENHFGKFFIEDGVIDESKWKNSKLKILFLLKEAYESNDDEVHEWSLAKYLKKGLPIVRKKMWWTVGQWAYGIQTMATNGKVEPFPEWL